jgi:hypothetical protein
MSKSKLPTLINEGPEPPCYNRQTKTDCPDRCGGCQLACEKWKAYVVERDKAYEKRMVEFYANAAMSEHRCDVRDKLAVRKQRINRHHR